MTRRMWPAIPLLGLTIFALPPAEAAPAGVAVGQCRAALLDRLDEKEMESYRIARIAERARRIRVDFRVTAGRPYLFSCTTDGSGRIVSTEFDPPHPRDNALAGR